ncbi:hypothetical protein CAEBREN_04414 [Caenorhabditis brenneri]|uniref:Uncharacterized protein n=1 Tax=Caenorhabditis brenneri TaxID=135651 RepID=G0N7F4_CAEBE|nr:hypothetical protein CAEBREN_04414 [Caenorhabditis brenneri]
MRPAILIVLVLFVFKCFGEAQKTGKVEAVIGLYCPDIPKWSWRLTLYQSDASGADTVLNDKNDMPEGQPFQYVGMVSDNCRIDRERVALTWRIAHRCAPKQLETIFNFSLHSSFSTEKTNYVFAAFNLQSGDHNADVYKKLFDRYFEKECHSGDCSSVRERVDCSILGDAKSVEPCKEGLESAYNMHQKSNLTTFIIIGAAVGVVLLIAAFVVVFFFCKKKKKNGPNASGMTSGGTSKTNSMTKSGTTKQTTTTGTFQKTAQTGTNVTGVQRY